MKRYHGKALIFKIQRSDYCPKRMMEFCHDTKVKDMIVLNHCNGNVENYMCFSMRNENLKYHWTNGSVSLARKLEVCPKTVEIFPLKRNGHLKMPDDFFIRFLDPLRPVDEQVVFVKGEYEKPDAIREHLEKVSLEAIFYPTPQKFLDQTHIEDILKTYDV